MIYQVLEIEKNGKPTGKYRKVEHNDSMTIMHGMCEHEHDTKEEAATCPEVVEGMKAVFPDPPKRGQQAYEAFMGTVGGKMVLHTNGPTPKWEELHELMREAWEAAAKAARG